MSKRFFALWLVLTLLLSLATPVVAAPDKVPVLIAFAQSPGLAEEALVRGVGGDIKYTYHLVPAIAASVPEAAVEGLRRNPKVVRVEPDIEVYAVDQVLPWGVNRIDAEVIHAAGNAGVGVKVAILDTGIDLDHPDLALAGSVNFASGKDADDKNGHGTHVAGTVAALNNSIGVIGVAPGVALYAVKVLGNGGTGSYSDVIAGLQWAVANGMKVTNNSYGSVGNPGATVKAAFDNAYAAGVLNIAAAGNESGGPVIYPAKWGSVVAVSATTQTDALAGFSSVGTEVELAAPGKDIYSTYKGDSYATLSGTSMASPHVAGTAALVIAAGIVTDLNGQYGIANEVRSRLRNTAEDLGATGKDNSFGCGLVDAEKAALGTPSSACLQVPTADDKSVSTNQDTPVVVTLTASDPETCQLAFSIVQGPAYGRLGAISNNPCISGSPNTDSATVTYTPNSGFSGSDSFAYTAYDGTVDSNRATVSVTVTAGNQAPTAANQLVSTNEDTPVSVTLTASDPETCELTFAIGTLPSKGSLGSLTNNACTSGSPNSDNATVTYTPNANFNGSDSFTYKANDGTADSNTATVSITVNAVNDAPVAANDSATTPVNTPVTINVLANDSDVDGGTLSVTNLTQPASGTATLNPDNTVTYAPNSNFTGNDSFTYTANDGIVNSNVATVSVAVTAGNQAPTADNKSLSTNEDTPVVVTLTASDPETCELAFSIVQAPASGSLGAISNNPCTSGSPNSDSATVTYTPNANFNGSDSFTYKANDGTANSNTATVSITVNAVNDAPVAGNDSATTPVNTPVTINVLANDSDVDGGTLSVTNLTQPANGTATLNPDNTVTYTPNSGFAGSDSFTYTANDGIVNSNVATVSVAVTAVITTGTITGTVKDASTGSGISGALVTAVGETSFSATTDSNGVYTIPNVPAGNYNVIASKKEAGLDLYEPVTQSATVSGGATTTLNFTLKPIMTVTNIEFWEQARGPWTDLYMRVTVKDALGRVVNGAGVTARLWRDDPSFREWSLSGTTNSSGQVTWVLQGAISGVTYNLEVQGVSQGSYSYHPERSAFYNGTYPTSSHKVGG